MRILFLHQNAPGQFRHFAPHLAADPANEIVVVGERLHRVPGRITWLRYKPPRPASAETHRYLHRMEASVRRGQAAARACLALQERGFEPDLVVAHAGWGETLFLRDTLPRAKILTYCEMFYRSQGQDTGFVPELALDLDGRCRLRVWNADLLTALETMDHGLAPTAWQRAQHPPAFQPNISVVHEGVDTDELAPVPDATFALPDGRALGADDEVVTFVARNLEPVRGFTVLMRALPELLRLRPRAEVVICGEDGVSYGRAPDGSATWREAMLRETEVDPARVHFVGRLGRDDFIRLLHVSCLHLYLTVPFVLSWSCIEALAAGCLVLASDVAPVREVLEDGENGFIVDGRSPAAVAGRAAELLAERAGLTGVRQRARASVVERYALARCLTAQETLVRHVAG